VSITINGLTAQLPDDPRVSLLDLLREHLHLSGTKKGCDQGACGACTVLVDGRERILSCLALAVQYEGRSITSIEGLGANGALHPRQRQSCCPVWWQSFCPVLSSVKRHDARG
jgi:xanthine dehydrogenase YagT iron-sulfur-binding subunit